MSEFTFSIIFNHKIYFVSFSEFFSINGINREKMVLCRFIQTPVRYDEFSSNKYFYFFKKEKVLREVVAKIPQIFPT